MDFIYGSLYAKRRTYPIMREERNIWIQSSVLVRPTEDEALARAESATLESNRVAEEARNASIRTVWEEYEQGQITARKKKELFDKLTGNVVKEKRVKQSVEYATFDPNDVYGAKQKARLEQEKHERLLRLKAEAEDRERQQLEEQERREQIQIAQREEKLKRSQEIRENHHRRIQEMYRQQLPAQKQPPLTVHMNAIVKLCFSQSNPMNIAIQWSAMERECGHVEYISVTNVDGLEFWISRSLIRNLTPIGYRDKYFGNAA